MRPLASTRNSFDARAGASFRSSSDGLAGIRGGYSLRRAGADGSGGCARLPFAPMSPLMPSASYSLTIRCRIPQTPARSRASPTRSARRAACSAPSTSSASTTDSVVRDVTVATVDATHGAAIVEAVRALPGIEVLSVSDRTFLLHRGGKIEVAPKVPDQDPRRPLDGVHAGRRARLHGDPRRPLRGLEPDDQGQHRGGRHRRHRGARPGRHRPRGGDAGDGGQGDAVQGVRRRRAWR